MKRDSFIYFTYLCIFKYFYTCGRLPLEWEKTEGKIVIQKTKLAYLIARQFKIFLGFSVLSLNYALNVKIF